MYSTKYRDLLALLIVLDEAESCAKLQRSPKTLTLSQYESISVEVADRSISQYLYEKKTVYARPSTGSVVMKAPVGNLLNKGCQAGKNSFVQLRRSRPLL